MTYHLEYSNQEYKREGTDLVLMLHGYGSQERDLLGIAQMIGGPITWAGMRAPQPVGAQLAPDADSALIPGAAMGYQWWPLNQSLDTDRRAVELATDYVIDWLEANTSTYKSVSLLGFSQGMALASSVARRRPDLITSLIGLSGYIVESDTGYFKDEAYSQQQIPFFYGRGTADPVITPAKLTYTEAWLADKTGVEFQQYEGLTHAVSRQEIDHIADFVSRKILGK